MPTANESIVAASGLVTVLVAAYSAYTGARGKGKDQHLAQTTSSYDNLQEDIKEKRDEIASLKMDVKTERERADVYHAQLMAQQDVRHELRSILRSAFVLLGDAGIDYRPLAERARATENA